MELVVLELVMLEMVVFKLVRCCECFGSGVGVVMFVWWCLCDGGGVVVWRCCRWWCWSQWFSSWCGDFGGGGLVLGGSVGCWC